MEDWLEGLHYGELESRLAAASVNPVHAAPLFRQVHRALRRDGLSVAEGVLPPLRRWLESDAAPALCPLDEAAETIGADGVTKKHLLRLGDGREVEAVRMGYPGRYTACLSSQVGCAMGCVFCATGQMGFTRHLSPAEIVAQAYHVERALRRDTGSRLRNLVMMGMGEPLHNFDATMEALEILTDSRGLNVGPGRVLISTVGHIPGIMRLARHPKRYALGVSLHGVTDEERERVVPANRKWPLADLLEACREYTRIKRARVFVAWTLIGGVNDGEEHARRLAELLDGMDVQVNLIPLNPTDGYSGEAPDAESVAGFQRILRERGLPVTVRQRRGIDVTAGCGQLKTGAGA
ncbi:MAG: 23S rRNA (adenine(2503)-C(2))-methyltransferase RlmN [Opitutales bacterium]